MVGAEQRKERMRELETHCKNIHLTDITTEVWNTLTNKLANFLGELPDRGSITKAEFKVNWRYDRYDETLDILIMKKPQDVLCALLKSRIKEFVDGCRNSTTVNREQQQ